jgi:LysR family nitrogen assimilation transcriptional regulator
MELWQLRYFVSVSETGSLARASSHLNIAAPAVSRAIKALEEELEVRLFDRDGRGMHPTDAGRTLLVRATSLLRDAELARQEVAAASSRHYGTVAIGMTPSVAATIGKPLIDLVRRRYADVQLRLMESYSGYLTDWVRTGSLGLAIVNGAPPEGARIASKRLMVERLFAIGRAGRFASDGLGASLRDLLGAPLLLPSSQHSARELIDAAAASLGLSVTTEVEVDSINVFRDLVMDGVADGILPFGAVRKEVEAGLLSATPVTDPEIHSETRVIHPVDAPLSRLTETLLAEIEEIIARTKSADGRRVFVDG